MTALDWYGLGGPAKLAALADRLHAACLCMLVTPNGDERLKTLVALPAPYPPPPVANKASEVDWRTRRAAPRPQQPSDFYALFGPCCAVMLSDCH